jgi:hypothetical protein
VQQAAPPELDAICSKALARAADDRYPSAHAMAAELSRAAEKAGCLASSMEAADLMRARMGQELTERRDAIQRYCSMLNGNSGAMRLGELAQLPKLLLSGGRPPVAGRVDLLHEVSPSARRLHDHETPGPPVTFEADSEDEAEAALAGVAAKGTRLAAPSRTRRVRPMLIGLVLVFGGAIAAGLWWRQQQQQHATAAMGSAPAPAPAVEAATARPPEPVAIAPAEPAQAPTAVAPDAPPASVTARPTSSKPEKHRSHRSQSSRSGDGADDKQGSEPALELNPYLHR